MSVSSDNHPFQCGLQTLTPRALSTEELKRDYLPLRYSTLHTEMNWAIGAPTGPHELFDEYDEKSWPFGIYFDEKLIAAIRLVLADTTAHLPSGRFIGNGEFVGRSAEISKAMVDQIARGCGLFNALITRCRLEALSIGIEHLFISVIDSNRVRKFLTREGFSVLGLPFTYTDHTISPKAQAVVLHQALGKEDLTSPMLSEHLQMLYAAACRRLPERVTGRDQEACKP